MSYLHEAIQNPENEEPLYDPPPDRTILHLMMLTLFVIMACLFFMLFNRMGIPTHSITCIDDYDNPVAFRDISTYALGNRGVSITFMNGSVSYITKVNYKKCKLNGKSIW